MAPGDLQEVLAVLKRPSLAVDNARNVLVGLGAADDAAVYRISEDLAIVETVDFFPPVVDDAYTWGAVAAANAMSDVYAMGGEVLFALNIAAWPEDAPLAQLEPALADLKRAAIFLKERSVDPRALVLAALKAAKHREADISYSLSNRDFMAS